MRKKESYIDYLEFMNLKGDYTFKDLKKSYIKLCKEYHPDKGGDEEKMKYLNNAKDYLEKRLKKSSSNINSEEKQKQEKREREERERKEREKREREEKERREREKREREEKERREREERERREREEREKREREERERREREKREREEKERREREEKETNNKKQKRNNNKPTDEEINNYWERKMNNSKKKKSNRPSFGEEHRLSSLIEFMVDWTNTHDEYVVRYIDGIRLSTEVLNTKEELYEYYMFKRYGDRPKNVNVKITIMIEKGKISLKDYDEYVKNHAKKEENKFNKEIEYNKLYREKFRNEKDINLKYLHCLTYFAQEYEVNEYNYLNILLFYSYIEQYKDKMKGYYEIDFVLESIRRKLNPNEYNTLFDYTKKTVYYLMDYIISISMNIETIDLYYEEFNAIKHIFLKKFEKNPFKQLLNSIEFYNELKTIIKEKRLVEHLINEVFALEKAIEYQKIELKNLVDKGIVNGNYNKSKTIYNNALFENITINKKYLLDNYIYDYQLINLLSKKYLLNDLFYVQNDFIDRIYKINNLDIKVLKEFFDKFINIYYYEIESYEKNDDIMKEYKIKRY